MTDRRFIYTIKNGTMIIIDKNDNVVIRDKYRACDYLNRLDNENEQLKKENKELEQIIETICEDYEKSHGMDIRNAEWFTAW